MTNLAQLLFIFKQAKACANDLANVIEASRIELLFHEIFEVISKCNTGRHNGNALTINNR